MSNPFKHLFTVRQELNEALGPGDLEPDEGPVYFQLGSVDTHPKGFVQNMRVLNGKNKGAQVPFFLILAQQSPRGFGAVRNNLQQLYGPGLLDLLSQDISEQEFAKQASDLMERVAGHVVVGSFTRAKDGVFVNPQLSFNAPRWASTKDAYEDPTCELSR